MEILREEDVETSACRYGLMSFFKNDTIVSRSLREYGEWAQAEIEFLLALVGSRDIVLDIGAFIGTHTLAFARRLNGGGEVYAFEPQPVFFEVLKKNVVQNGIANVKLFNAAVSEEVSQANVSELDVRNAGNFAGTSICDGVCTSRGDHKHYTIDVMTVDQLAIDRCDLIKIDAENMEINILRGARQTLVAKRPVVFAECNSLQYGWPVVEFMKGQGYSTYLLNVPAYNTNNFRQIVDNFLTDGREAGLIFIPVERLSGVQDQLNQSQRLPSLIPVATLDDLGLGLIKKPQYKYEIMSKSAAARVLDVEFWANETEVQQFRSDAKGLQTERDRLNQEAVRLQAERDRLNQEAVRLYALIQGQQQALNAKGQEMVQLQAERDRLNQEAADLQALIQGQQQTLDVKGQELVRLQAAAQTYEQELATITNTIGWKALNKYRETREKSRVFRYLHFLFTEPVKRGSKKKNDIADRANTLTPPNGISPYDGPQPSIIERPDVGSTGSVSGTEERLRDVNLPARDYPAWRQLRQTERLDQSAQLIGRRNNLISLIVYVTDAGNPSARLDVTLRSVLQQTYRNIEVLVVGGSIGNADHAANFAIYRGLFFEPALSHLDILRDLRADTLWRGGHLMFAQAGTMFDADTFGMLNAALNTAVDARGPDLVLCDHDRITGAHEFSEPSFTPGWDPDLIQSHDYIETAFVASRALVQRRRPQTTSCASLHDWLRMIAQQESHLATHHVTEPLVHIPQLDAAPLPPVPVAFADPCAMPDLSVIVPNRNRAELLAQCLSFMKFPNRFRIELVIVDNASDDADVLSMYEQLRERNNAKIVSMNQKFNFAHMVNIGVAASTSPVLLLLNNDVQITLPGLLEQILAHALRPEVGVVGTKLLNADGSVQHGGMLLREGHAGVQTMLALHVLRGAERGDTGYLDALSSVRNYQAVTGALMASRREVFLEVGGFDEVYLPVELNDVDYCLRVRKAGYRVLCLPLDGIFHFESSTRGTELSPEVARMRQAAMACMAGRWREQFRHDPYRNPWVELGNVARARFSWSRGEGSAL
jgi:O-antigen biosynthesis protein